MAGAILTSNSPKALWPGVKGWWGRSYDDHVVEYTDLVDVTTSEQAWEEFCMITPFGVVPQKPQGTAAVYDSEVQGPTTRMTHVAYALGYIVSHEEMQDNLYMEVSKTRASSLARAFRQTKERVVAGLYNRAFTAGYTGADGIILCATNHPNVSGGTYSNCLAVAADLSEASIEDMVIQIMGATDDRGNLINLMPKSLHVAPANWFEANRIMKSIYQNNTANNAINVLQAVNTIPEGIKLNHYFTAPQAWFIRTNVAKEKGMILLEREAISFTQDNDFDTKNIKALGYERYSQGWIDPRGLYGSNGP